jgi:uncharacterized protein with HEPN domain
LNRFFLGQVRDAIRDIEEYASVGRDAFMTERMRQDAVQALLLEPSDDTTP